MINDNVKYKGKRGTVIFLMGQDAKVKFTNGDEILLPINELR